MLLYETQALALPLGQPDESGWVQEALTPLLRRLLPPKCVQSHIQMRSRFAKASFVQEFLALDYLLLNVAEWCLTLLFCLCRHVPPPLVCSENLTCAASFTRVLTN
jgi:hypothetical protein